MKKKLCDTCIYRNNVEQLKPCIIYRDNCEYYEREEDMTIEEAIQKVSVGLLNGAIDCDDSDYYKAIKVLLNSIAHSMSIKALEQEPKTGHWTHDGSHWKNRFICSECGYKLFDEPTNYCPNCGVRIESEDKV